MGCTVHVFCVMFCNSFHLTLFKTLDIDFIHIEDGYLISHLELIWIIEKVHVALLSLLSWLQCRCQTKWKSKKWMSYKLFNCHYRRKRGSMNPQYQHVWAKRRRRWRDQILLVNFHKVLYYTLTKQNKLYRYCLQPCIRWCTQFIIYLAWFNIFFYPIHVYCKFI